MSSVTHLLVTNDFPPKVGGIQNYLWELWRRLPPAEFVVLTTPYDGDDAWDREQKFTVVRARDRVLLPTPSLRRRIDGLASESGADLVVLDPALPLGHLGPALHHPYAVVVHGAEITVPGRLPGTRAFLARVLRHAGLVVAAGAYAAAEATHAAGRPLPTVVVPPGVDVERFVPLDAAAKSAARARFRLPADVPLVVAVSRLVPRKGFDVLLRAADRVARTGRSFGVAIAGRGRDEGRLRHLASGGAADVRFLGRVPDADLPALYGCADIFAMCCRDRWGGLEQEGFGIVFLEAAAAGVAQVAGASGGAADAVIHGATGLVVDHPEDPEPVAIALARLLDDPALRARLGAAARQRAVEEFTYDDLAARLGSALRRLASS
jgi:phosphatidylinositol alpha-1,6-mannosyltransferase